FARVERFDLDQPLLGEQFHEGVEESRDLERLRRPGAEPAVHVQEAVGDLLPQVASTGRRLVVTGCVSHHSASPIPDGGAPAPRTPSPLQLCPSSGTRGAWRGGGDPWSPAGRLRPP